MKKTSILIIAVVCVLLMSNVASAGFFDWTTGDFWRDMFKKKVTPKVIPKADVPEMEVEAAKESVPEEAEDGGIAFPKDEPILECDKRIRIKDLYYDNYERAKMASILVGTLGTNIKEGDSDTIDKVKITVQDVNLEEENAKLLIECIHEFSSTGTGVEGMAADTVESFWNGCALYDLPNVESSEGTTGEDFCSTKRKSCLMGIQVSNIWYYDTDGENRYRCNLIGENSHVQMLDLNEERVSCSEPLHVGGECSRKGTGQQPYKGDYHNRQQAKIICCS